MLGTLRGPRGWGLVRGARTRGAGMREHTLRRFYTWGLHTRARTHLHVHLQVSQLPRLHTHTTHVLTHQASPRQGARAHEPTPRLVTRTTVGMPPCTHMWEVMSVRAHASFPLHTDKWTSASGYTHTHTHTHVAHNSSYKCAGTKVKGTNSTGLHISSGWGGAHDSLHLPPHGWTRPLPLPHKGTFNSGQ